MLVEISSKPQILIRTTGIGCDSIQTPDLICINSGSLFIFLSQAYPPFRHCLLHAHTFKPECVPTWVVPSNMCKALVQKCAVVGFGKRTFRTDLAHEAALVFDQRIHLLPAAMCTERSIFPDLSRKKKKVCQ